MRADDPTPGSIGSTNVLERPELLPVGILEDLLPDLELSQGGG